MNILLLETATPVCSVVLMKDGWIAAHEESAAPNSHSSMMAKFVESVLESTETKPHELDAVCVSSGPGSYTGLRIGVSSAKGFCYALNIPLLSVPTLKSMAAQYYAKHPEFEGLVCPMIDARRMECYSAIFDKNLNEIKPVSADIIEEGIYDAFMAEKKVVFVGDGAMKTKSILGVNKNAMYDESFVISAEGMSKLAVEKMEKKEYEDVAYFEPFYLKDFVAAKPVVKGLK
ncbi:MAG: tRNA (adenosine(37)-N6)-threonylcarbamoyltransferase complex dimerization subunit type 1 TsaB [Bacteroidales bacterium]|nr:tRNA (adenosine(37)-N6)-threonylcarbamoyltransferase complex dimerization subunit type 1 TsaB [Bacteroidales bacterium]